MKLNKQAFTLIELLVVIAIVGILSGLIIISMNGSINSANDAKRKSNLDAIRKALVVYGTLNNRIYPIQPTTCNIGPTGTTNRCDNLASALQELLPTLPIDPVSGYYTYISDATGSSYVLSGNLSSSTYSYSSNSGANAAGPTDIDGNSYSAVIIGSQTWMGSNLMTTRYNDGSAITRGPTTATWTADNGYYAYPPNIGNTAEESLANIQANKLGFVYQLSAVNTNKLCPTGWHVPTDAEWCTLEQYVDPSISCSTTGWRGTDGGLKLKEAGTTHWTTSSTIGTNTSGFTGIASGCRGTTGSFYNRSANAYFWASGASGWNRHLNYSYATVYRTTNSAAYGFSVRCLKD